MFLRPTTWGVLLLALVLGVLGAGWWTSLVPQTYSVMDMGYPDYGGGSAVGHAHVRPPAAHHGPPAPTAAAAATEPGTVAVTDLTGPHDGVPDVSVTLTAREERFTLASGEEVDGFTLDGTSPGPTIEAVQGDLVEVTLVNESVREGAALHWHGIAVPNAEDGVAGVTQDAVPVHGRHTYRFVARDAGTYWYHSHQVSHEQVVGGLFGAVVVHPGGAGAAAEATAPADLVLPVHTYDGIRTLAGRSSPTHTTVPAGTQVRLRVLNTDSANLRAWVTGADFRVLAVDGREINAPAPVHGEAVHVPGGGRVDLGVDVPAAGLVLHVGGRPTLRVGPGKQPTAEPGAAPTREVDLLSYGEPAPLPFDVAAPDRHFEYAVGRRVGFVDGRPGLWWTVNGHLYPDVPMFLVEEGDVVVMTLRNSSGTVHPMHLHGHHVVVLSRNGERATGSPWWTDTLDVASGASYEVAFVADNPGIWLDHCHNLQHAADGMVAHLAYAGVTTPYVIGGDAANHPE